MKFIFAALVLLTLSGCEYFTVSHKRVAAPTSFTTYADSLLANTKRGPVQGGPIFRMSNGDVLAISTSIFRSTDDGSTWSLYKENLLAHRSSFQAVKISGNRIWIFGGDKGASTCELSTEILNTTTMTLTPGPDLITGRRSSVSAVLNNGRILITGGQHCGGGDPNLDSTEIFNPADETIAPAASMITKRTIFGMATIADGRVIAAGGANAINFLSDAEIYDFGTNTWSPLPAMASDRSYVQGIGLADGRFMMVGGYRSGAFRAESQVYDPGLNTWSSYPIPVAGTPTCALLADTRVFCTGGNTWTGPSTINYIFNPTTNIWTSLNNTEITSYGGYIYQQLSGKVLVLGAGNNYGLDERMTTFDPSNDSITFNGDTRSTFAYNQGAVFHSNGLIYEFGGAGPLGAVNSIKAIDTNSLSNTFFVPTITARHQLHASELNNGKILTFGGANISNVSLGTVEMFDPATPSISAESSLSVPRHAGEFIKLTDGRIILVGGLTNAAHLSSIDIYDGVGAWTAGTSMATARSAHALFKLDANRLLVIGGKNGTGDLASTEIYNIALDTWAAGPSMSVARSSFASLQLPDGRILVAGGESTGVNLTSTEIYDPALNSWTAGPSLSVARKNGKMALTGKGNVLVFGGGNTKALASTDLINLTSHSVTTGPSLNEERSSGYISGVDPSNKLWLINGLSYFLARLEHAEYVDLNQL